jgi:acylphosphatase
MENARVHMIIKGQVQGVFFRYSTMDEAKSLGVFGWVRNLRSGDVECVAEGEKDALEKLVDWCHHGPSHARVREVDPIWSEYKGEFTDFSMMRTV